MKFVPKSEINLKTASNKFAASFGFFVFCPRIFFQCKNYQSHNRKIDELHISLLLLIAKFWSQATTKCIKKTGVKGCCLFWELSVNLSAVILLSSLPCRFIKLHGNHTCFCGLQLFGILISNGKVVCFCVVFHLPHWFKAGFQYFPNKFCSLIIKPVGMVGLQIYRIMKT